MKTEVVQLRQRGVLTLPRGVREKYRLEVGDPLTLVDLDGILLLSPKLSVVPKLTAEIERLEREAGITVDDLLAGLPRPPVSGRGRRADR